GEIEHIGWKRVRQRRAAAAQINTTPDIEPLITINLNQSYPFNVFCPTIDGVNTIVGCAAVGMAQAIMVQGYPAKPEGKYSYQCANTGWHYLNYDDEPAYDWDAIYACESTGNYEEVARLLYHCGESFNMEYGLDASGAKSAFIAEALVRNFGYNTNTIRYSPKLPDDAAWLDMLLDELEKGRVVIYHGQSDRGGHCWNIDGWKQATQMVHCNWGWLGYGNGYFSLDNLTDSYQGLSFLNNQGAILGVVAPTNAPYDILLDKTHFIEGTEAGVALANVQVMSEDNNATYTYEVSGVDGTTNTPYRVVDGQIVSTETIADDIEFKYLHIKAINNATKESYEKDFDIQVVSGEVYNLVGKYKASAYSEALNGSLIEWEISITVDKDDPAKVWLKPIILFANLKPVSITPVYAIYDEEENTLSMPLGQVVYDTYSNKLVISTTVDANSYNLTDNVIMQVSYDSGVEIEYADEYFLCVTDILSEPFALYEGISGVTLEKKSSVIPDLSYLEGTYRATAHSAFPGYDDELWSVNMTVDKDDPGKVWIQPICMFGLSAEYIAPVYAIYEDDNTLLMPLGQIV
ncbi:MAG: C10 family peptidase, partial [Bacteroidaceae bacterium]|nr:C10 family peptidase [Bacteroidaceae bacterium]